MARRAARGIAMQLLYASSMTGNFDEAVMQESMEEVTLNEADKQYILQTVKGVLEKIVTLDEIINRLAIGWQTSRMARVDTNILRLALYEMAYSNIPSNICINEAVELAKQYSTAEASRFINGILGCYVREKEGK